MLTKLIFISFPAIDILGEIHTRFSCAVLLASPKSLAQAQSSHSYC